MEMVRGRLAASMEKTIERLDEIGIAPWLVPQAGMFAWCRLPDGADAAAIARDCLKAGVIIAPGNAFSLSQTASSFLRFNVAQSQDDRIFEVLGRALRGRGSVQELFARSKLKGGRSCNKSAGIDVCDVTVGETRQCRCSP
jgi:DNA-binding transcriptional MocR family regulator